MLSLLIASLRDTMPISEVPMYHYDPKLALDELQEDALLPHPVKLRDMILRVQLAPKEAQLLNHDFQDYLTRFGEIQHVARSILEKLAAATPKAS
jgi:isochorismate hydrolase